MIRRANLKVALALGVILPFADPAGAQLVLPGAAAPAPAGSKLKPATRPSAARPAGHAVTHPALGAPPALASILDHPLRLNGKAGVLKLSMRDNVLRIEQLKLSGEFISDSSKHCEVELTTEKPIVAEAQGRPDGLLRFSADIPACPLSFDVVDGGVAAPAQNAACVFQAADCQTSPAGVWGPEGASLVKIAPEIAKERRRADEEMSSNLRALLARQAGSPAALETTRGQNGFVADRTDLCREYDREREHGFCTARVTTARAAFLRARFEEAPPPVPAAPGKKASAKKPR